MTSLKHHEITLVEEQLAKHALRGNSLDPRERFPDPKDRSVNQPSVIIQPDLVVKMAQSIMQNMRIISVGDRKDQINDEVFHNVIQLIINAHAGELDQQYAWNDHIVFMKIARVVGWGTVTMTGRQIILTASFDKPQK